MFEIFFEIQNLMCFKTIFNYFQKQNLFENSNIKNHDLFWIKILIKNMMYIVKLNLTSLSFFKNCLLNMELEFHLIGGRMFELCFPICNYLSIPVHGEEC